MQQLPDSEVHSSTTSRVLAVVSWVLVAVLLLDVARRGSFPSGLLAALGLALAALAAYAFWWRPSIEVDDDAVTLHNPLRDVRVPWPAVLAVGGRWSLDIRTADRSWTAYAAAPRRRPRSRPVGLGAEVAVEPPRAPSPGVSVRLSERWERRRLLAPEGPVVVRWRLEVLVPAAVLVTAIVVTVVLQ